MELLVVFGLLVAVCGFCVFVDGQSREFFSFAADRDLVLSALRRARAMAVNSICFGAGCVSGQSHGVHFDPAKKEAIIFQGDDFSARDCDFDEIIEFENQAVCIVAPFPVDIIFFPPAGDAGSSNVALKDDRGHYADISVNESGRIDWQ